MNEITILGSGMAGLGASYAAKEAGVSCITYDKNTYPGGHTASWNSGNGFWFDEGPHISFTKNPRVETLLEESVSGLFESFTAEVNNYWKGHWIKHPAQCNLFGLPPDLLVRVILDFIDASTSKHADISNYEDWLVASFGQTFARTFPMEYGHRYHTTTADNMSIDWLGPRIYRPELEEVLSGALSATSADVHYVSSFRYPSQGGFQSFLKKFIETTDIRLGHEVTGVDLRRQILEFADGSKVEYKNLVSSIPLPVFISLIDDVPADVTAAAERLACTSCMTVNLGIDRADISDAHWTYFYDKEFVFTRLSFPHKFSPGNAPMGMSSIQAEIYYSSKYMPLKYTEEECIARTIEDLQRCGLLKKNDNIVFQSARNIQFANVIFDLDRTGALATVNRFLDDASIHTAGRYGKWGYQWTDESFLSGERAVQEILVQAF